MHSQATQKYPLASMLLITFNQENTILEALGGAVNQDYPNTEIIVCDDASQDSTFQKVIEFTKNYHGPHKIIYHKNPKNIGIGGNINQAVKLSSGNFFFMTAGDDISLSHRVSTVMNFWKEKNHSVDLIACYLKDLDSESKTHELISVADLSKYKNMDDWIKLGHPKLIGAAQAWTRNLYESYEGLPQGTVAEDMLMAFRAIAMGRATTIPEALVLYRRGGTTSKKDRSSAADVISSLTKKTFNTKIELLDMLKTAAKNSPSPMVLNYLTALYEKEVLIENLFKTHKTKKEKLNLLISNQSENTSKKTRLFLYSITPTVMDFFLALRKFHKRHKTK